MGDLNFPIELLNEHNKLRRIYGDVKSLELDDELSRKAQEHAEFLASKQSKLENSKDETVGENLYYLESPDGHYTAKHIVEYWIRRSNFDLNWPVHNRNKPTSTNHFTQMVWKNSSKLGVGVAKAENNAIYVAAFYFPRGNVVNHIDENVIFEQQQTNGVDSNAEADAASSESGSSDSSNEATHQTTVSQQQQQKQQQQQLQQGKSESNDGQLNGQNGHTSGNGKSKEKKLEDKVVNTLDKIMKKADKEKTGKISLTKAKKIFQLINEKFHTEYTNMDAKKFFEQFDNEQLEDGKVGHKDFKKALIDLKLKLPLH